MIERNEPAIYKTDFEDGVYPLTEFYNDEDDVVYESVDGMDVVYDFDDNFIMTQHDGKDTYMINLLYARKHARPLYDRFYQLKNTKREQGVIVPRPNQNARKTR